MGLALLKLNPLAFDPTGGQSSGPHGLGLDQENSIDTEPAGKLGSCPGNARFSARSPGSGAREPGLGTLPRDTPRFNTITASLVEVALEGPRAYET